MSDNQNLLYGANIIDYGALGDGKTDCSSAFAKAIDGGENLISVPFGVYVFTKPLVLNSNVKLSIHPKAKLIFALDNKKERACVYNRDTKDGNSGIIISGGVWVCDKSHKTGLFCFENVNYLTLSNIEIISNSKNIAISVSNVQNFKFCDIKCDGNDTGDFLYIFSCKDGVLRNLCVRNCIYGILFSSYSKNSGYIENILSHNLTFDNCGTIMSFDKKCENVSKIYINGLYGSFRNNAVSALCYTQDVSISDISLYVCAVQASSDTDCYFLFGTEQSGFEIENFKRNTDLETCPLMPSAVMYSDSQALECIIDGLLLDDIIRSRALSKDVLMTAAKISNPHNKFLYTLELSISSGQRFILKGGSFDTLSLSI